MIVTTVDGRGEEGAGGGNGISGDVAGAGYDNGCGCVDMGGGGNDEDGGGEGSSSMAGEK